MQKLFYLLILTFCFTSHAGINSVSEPRVKWIKRDIHVCWQSGGNDFKRAQRKTVQRIIEKEFKLSKVGITFTGWESCSNLQPDEIDLQIYQDIEGKPITEAIRSFRESNAEGSSVIGEGSLREKITTHDINTNEILSSYEGYFNRNLTKPVVFLLYRPTAKDFLLELTALHEFGHITGLRHEHIRPEAALDPNCKNFSDFKQDETIGDSAYIFEEYDPNSIMNYCWVSTLALSELLFKKLPNVQDESIYTKNKTEEMETYFEIRVGLSTKDITLLKKLYPL